MSGTHEPGTDAASPAPAGTVLGFDFGTRKIGVALGNTITGTARALTTLRPLSNAARDAAIGALIVEWAPVSLVVGRPVHADGRAHAMTALADKFAAHLGRRFGLPVARVDERYTTEIAAIEQEHDREARAAGRDAGAAAIILQTWLDARAAA